MTRSVMLLLSMLSAAPGGRAQPAAAEPPKVGQPADFSQIVGAFRITADAAPTTVAVEQPVRLTITITGQAQHPYTPTREHLRLFPEELLRDFFIEPVSEQAQAGAWQFVYDLRPKHTRIQFVPGMKLVYYAPRQRRYQTAYTDAISLKVNPRQDIAVDVKGLKVIQAPPGFFELAEEDTTDDGLSREIFQPGIALRLAILPPLLCIVGIWWKRRQRRSNVIQTRRWRRLTDATITALATHPCDSVVTARLLTVYLKERFSIPTAEPTPVEVDRCLKRRGVSKAVRQRWQQMLEAFDASRYGQNHKIANLVDSSTAIHLIQISEAEPCSAA